jgi:hypothetical protein
VRIAQVGAGLILVLFCVCLQAATQELKMTVTGTLVRVGAIGGESTGWAIQFDSEINIDGKHAISIEVDYPQTKKLDELENKRVKATGKLSRRYGVEMGERSVLDISSITEANGR